MKISEIHQRSRNSIEQEEIRFFITKTTTMKRSIHNTDCIEFMKTLDKCVNLVVTDPPYNVSRENNFSTLKGAERQ
jgi:DNA modification methylase